MKHVVATSLLWLTASACTGLGSGPIFDHTDGRVAPSFDASLEGSIDASPTTPDATAPSWDPPPYVLGTDTPHAPALQELHPAGDVWADFFGGTVAISPDGRAVAIAALRDGGYASADPMGSVYVFEDPGDGHFVQAAYLHVDGAFGFGAALAIDGQRLVVGADGFEGGRPGKVYVYERDAALGWVARATLPPPVAPAVGFGHCVALDGTVVLACGSDFVALFARTAAGDWAPSHVLVPPVPHLPGSSGGFGASLALDGDTLVIGDTTAATGGVTTGAAMVFDRGGPTGWTFASALPAVQVEDRGVGWRVAIAGDRIAVTGIEWPGSVDVWERRAGAWTPTAHLGAQSAVSNYWAFGNGLAIAGEQVLVGTGTWSNPLQDDPGHVYAYRHGATGWAGDGQVIVPGLAAQDNFGVAIAAGGGRIVIGADTDAAACPGGADCSAGAAYVYAAP